MAAGLSLVAPARLVADAEKKKSVFHSDWIECNWVCTSEAGRNGCKYNYWRRYGFTEQSEHWAVELRWSDLGRRLDERCLASVTPRMRVPKCRRDFKQRHCSDSQKYQSSDVNKSIAITIIDWHVHRWFAAKLTFGQEMRLIRSVASPGSQRWSH